MRRQAELFERPPRPPARKLMHVRDAGYAAGGVIAEFKCGRCGHESGWLHIGTVTEAKRGLPCPKCNPGEIAA
ncbi:MULTISPECIES: hypothetical protein [unclassified Bradyrhizobium]|uniref:hypothetical protein n=1 Tax=unclassified Bradyrhizobium TaxID=2631580 RepID=UPI0029170134|nr:MULTISPECIES: hypothetical protein [unclassified Bradyrhizobium]